jgi:hypothetical protein
VPANVVPELELAIDEPELELAAVVEEYTVERRGALSEPSAQRPVQV